VRRAREAAAARDGRAFENVGNAPGHFLGVLPFSPLVAAATDASARAVKPPVRFDDELDAPVQQKPASAASPSAPPQRSFARRAPSLSPPANAGKKRARIDGDKDDGDDKDDGAGADACEHCGAVVPAAASAAASSASLARFADEFAAVEARYRVLMQLRALAVTQGHVTNAQADQLAEKVDLTGRQLRMLHQQVLDSESLLRRPGSGRPRSGVRAQVEAFLEEHAFEWHYQFTLEGMAQAVGDRFDRAYGHKESVRRLLIQLDWKAKKQRIVPTLLQHHLDARYEWAKEWKDYSWCEKKVMIVHVDEKLFYVFRTGKTLYLPPDVDAPVQTARSKTQIPSVMFLGAVGFPIPGFDGDVGIWPIGEWGKAKVNSKFFKVRTARAWPAAHASLHFAHAGAERRQEVHQGRHEQEDVQADAEGERGRGSAAEGTGVGGADRDPGGLGRRARSS
jgi:hypothetical protein